MERRGVMAQAKNISNWLEEQFYGMANSYEKGLADWISKKDPGVDVTHYNNNIKIAYKVMQENTPQEDRLIDMKRWFAMSDKRKHRKDGTGWYVRVPLRIKATQGRKAYGRGVWDRQVASAPFGATAQIRDPDIKNRVQQTLGQKQQGAIFSLKYRWKSANVTREQWGNSKRGQYFAYRTVSDKSPMSSWLIHRKSFSESTEGQELQPYISQILKAQMAEYNAKGSNF